MAWDGGLADGQALTERGAKGWKAIISLVAVDVIIVEGVRWLNIDTGSVSLTSKRLEG